MSITSVLMVGDTVTNELQQLVLEQIRLIRLRNRAKKSFDKISSQINNVNYNINTLLDEEEALERKRAGNGVIS